MRRGLTTISATCGLNAVKTSKGSQLIRRALELDPGNGAYVDSLGWLYFKQGKFQEALTELLRAAELLPTQTLWCLSISETPTTSLARMPKRSSIGRRRFSSVPRTRQLRRSSTRAPRTSPSNRDRIRP